MRKTLYWVHLLLPAAAVPLLGIAFGQSVGWNPETLALTVLALGTAAVYLADRVVFPSARVQDELSPQALRVGQGLCVLALSLSGVLLLFGKKSLFLPLFVMLALFLLRFLIQGWFLGKTVPVSACWTIGAVIVPYHFRSDVWWTLLQPAALAMFLLVFAGCLLCDAKDLEEDTRAGSRSLSVLLGRQRLLGCSVILCLLSVLPALEAGLPELLLGTLGFLLLVGLASRWLFDGFYGALLVDLALALPGLACLLV